MLLVWVITNNRAVQGAAGDFFTSVSVGPLFGQLLAFQFAQWLDTALPAGKFRSSKQERTMAV